MTPPLAKGVESDAPGPLGQTTWRDMDGPCVFTSRAAARDAEVKK